jgi:hypothetical protein
MGRWTGDSMLDGDPSEKAGALLEESDAGRNSDDEA